MRWGKLLESIKQSWQSELLALLLVLSWLAVRLLSLIVRRLEKGNLVVSLNGKDILVLSIQGGKAAKKGGAPHIQQVKAKTEVPNELGTPKMGSLTLSCVRVRHVS